MMKIAPRKTSQGIEIGPTLSTEGRSIVLVNPENRSYTENRFVLAFGGYGWTRLMVWERSLDDALETAAEWLAEHAPGHVMECGSDEHTALVREACEEAGLAWPMPDDIYDGTHPEYERAIESAESGMVHCDRGVMISDDWSVALENPSRKELEQYLYPR